MKIGILLWSLDLRGGTEKQALELAVQLQRLGHDIQLYSRFYKADQTFTELVRQLKPPVFLEERPPKGGGLLQKLLLYVDLFRSSRKLSLLIDDDLDILNCHDATTFPAAALFSKRTGIPVVASINDTPSYQSAFRPRDGIVRYVISKAKGLLLAPDMRAMDEIAVLDNLNKNRLQDYFSLDSVITRSGLDIAELPYSERSLAKPVRLLLVGNFFAWRRYEDVVDALAILKKKNIAFELHHFGATSTSQAYARKILGKVRDAGLSDRVIFHGDAGRAKLRQLFAEAHIFLFPNYPQTWGLALFEALASGVPAIASAACGGAEVLTDGENVLLVPPCSPQDIAGAIERLSNDPDLWRRLAVAGRHFVEENIRWDLYAQRMLEVFRVARRKRNLSPVD